MALVKKTLKNFQEWYQYFAVYLLLIIREKSMLLKSWNIEVFVQAVFNLPKNEETRLSFVKMKLIIKQESC